MKARLRPDGVVANPRDTRVLNVIQRAGSPLEYQDAPEFQADGDGDIAVMIEAARRIGRVE